MSVDVVTLVGGAIGGAAVSSVLGPLFGQVHQRRELRGRALASLADVERERWAENEDRAPFRSAVTGLRANALVAGVSRYLIDTYLEAAAAGYSMSLRNWEMSGGDPEGGSITVPLSVYVGECRAALNQSLWHPTWSRVIRWRIRLRLLHFKSLATAESVHDSPIQWDQIWLPG
jgi:hypothetical protein